MFISLEGIDRSGKTTQAAMLAEALGPAALRVREPGGTEAGERVRAMLKDADLDLDPTAELLLFCAARAELCARVIRPALERGAEVICDRFVDSTAAYQGAARGLGIELVEGINSVAVGTAMPDLTLLLRVGPEEALRRGQLRLEAGDEDGSDRFESEGLELQRRVAAAYDELASRHRDRIVVIDAEADPEAVHARVMAAVEERRR